MEPGWLEQRPAQPRPCGYKHFVDKQTVVNHPRTLNPNKRPLPSFLSNFKRTDFAYQTVNPFSQRVSATKFVSPGNLFSIVSTYNTHLKPQTFRNQAVNFQGEISKACSDWVVYYSSVTEVWGFTLTGAALAENPFFVTILSIVLIFTAFSDTVLVYFDIYRVFLSFCFGIACPLP